MSDDHFVAQTYLKHFGDAKAGGMLHAYRKTDGKEFPCWPKDVCTEWEGDLNDAFPDNPRVLGDFRKIFEPYWNPAIQTILEGSSIDPSEKFAISGYMANLMVCTPAWRRVAEKIYRAGVLGTLRFSQEMAERHGKPDQLLKEGLDEIDKGTIAMDVDPGHIKAKVTKSLMMWACLIYDLDWVVVRNDTNQLFVTSDNPVALDSDDRGGAPLTRLLTITPRLCLSVRMNGHPIRPSTPEDLKQVITSPPKGRLFRAQARPQGVRETNKLIVQCAEELVFSSDDDPGIRQLTKKYAKFRIDTDAIEVRKPEEPNAIYHGFVVRVKESG